jgi:hypothetical protein
MLIGHDSRREGQQRANDGEQHADGSLGHRVEHHRDCRDRAHDPDDQALEHRVRERTADRVLGTLGLGAVGPSATLDRVRLHG